MGPDTVIDVENLSKVYRLGAREEPYRTFRDALAGWVAAPLRRLRQLSRLTHFDDLPPGAGSGGEGQPADVVWALRDVSFRVGRGEILGIIGRNGAGKSTLLKVLSRITCPTAGLATIRGRVGSLLEVGTGFHPELTGRENIYLNGAILGMAKAEIERKFDEIVEFSGVAKFIDTPVKRYSSGMHVRLAFAVAAHLEPEILLVDEVLAVGDFEFQKKCLGKMDEVTRGGRTVLFVSHNMSAVASLTQRCLVLDQGRAAFLGPTDDAIRWYTAAREPVLAAGRRSLNELPIQKRLLNDPRVQFVELGLAADQALEVPVGGEVVVDVLLSSTQPFKALHFGYTVKDRFGAPVLSGVSPGFSLPAGGAQQRLLRVQDLWLLPGGYELSLCVQSGDLHANRYIYDGVVGFARFEVKPFFGDHRPLARLDRHAAAVLHLSSSVSDGHTPSPGNAQP